MSYFNENLKALNIKELIAEDTAIFFILNKGVVVDGFKKIFELSNDKITLSLKCGETLTISGTNLEIKEIATGEISVSGKIKNIQVN